ncbi:UDP-N-acetylglucosamine transferase subunit ALG13 [Anabrus simplex]|uniref:UDP-N-acetylglucosamine transferase subunit ALG13 n=1 Tax=Anabrus simplex TaxID=316456 RepID=UPI0034DD1819
MAPGQILATVGTTKFDLFITTICTPEVLRVLRDKGYSKLNLQIGNGKFEPERGIVEGIHVDYFRFKDSIKDDIENADLVISHAGAGSCLEVLYAKKPLVVVVNELLMDNHQLELAQQLATDGHLIYCTCNELQKTLKYLNPHSLQPFAKCKSDRFVYFLDSIYGYNERIYS